jgi:c-di-GMP-binding flagellar brake protein YcgR
VEAIRKQRSDFIVVPLDGQGEMVQEMLVGQSFIDLYIPDSALLFRASIRQTDAPSRYFLAFPDFVAQVERRKSLRLQVYESDGVKINFSKMMVAIRPLTQQFNKSCFDISSGGFSFMASRMESKFFKINDPIRTIEFEVDGKKFYANAEVALIKEIEPDEFNGLTYKVWRVCCRFSHIDMNAKKHLDIYILEKIKEELNAI